MRVDTAVTYPTGYATSGLRTNFNATDAPEDKEKEETFTPKPYTGTTAKPAQKPKKAEKKPKKQQDNPSDGYEQISLEGVI